MDAILSPTRRGTMRETSHPTSLVLPNTQFFEIDSTIVGRTYGVWVTTPPGYDPDARQSYPAIFMADGNMAAPMTIPYVSMLSTLDYIFPIAPFIQVAIGYVDADADDFFDIRTRDLVPPGEPMSPTLIAQTNAAIAAGELSADDDRSTLDALTASGGRADLFMGFLTDELYPEITRRWRIDAPASGFFGVSYGGLFACWLAMQRHPLFPRIGAGSAGLLTLDSKVFNLLDDEMASGADHSGRHLHLSLCLPEITQPTFYQDLSQGNVHLLGRLGSAPLKGLTLTSHMIPHESHLTGIPSHYFSFLRTCYPGPNVPM
ncbi:alpha/beta hydrolase [Rhodococcus qingshengii]|uniref:alpha/beta hydrolase n=1 Tax=Rhodococcus qingshengii TaxID=334542 RepID=UPI0036DD6C41